MVPRDIPAYDRAFQEDLLVLATDGSQLPRSGIRRGVSGYVEAVERDRLLLVLLDGAGMLRVFVNKRDFASFFEIQR